MHTVLLSDRGRYWSKFLADADLGSRPIVDLDPGSAERKPAGRYERESEGRSEDWVFAGNIDFRRHPLNWVEAMRRLVPEEPSVVVLPCYPWSPSVRDLIREALWQLGPERVLVPDDAEFAEFEWSLPADRVPVEDDLPQEAKDAQRNARWMELLQSGADAELDVDSLQTSGARLGFGQRVSPARHSWADRLGEAVYLQPPVLFSISSFEPAPIDVSEALESSGCSKFVTVSPDRYEGLLCAPSDGSGRELGFGVVKRLDTETMRLAVRTTARDPSFAKLLKLGSLWIGEQGQPSERLNQWAY